MTTIASGQNTGSLLAPSPQPPTKPQEGSPGTPAPQAAAPASTLALCPEGRGHGDRRFAHIVSVGGQVHCLEVIRKHDRYRACLYVCVDRLLLLQSGSNTWELPPRPAHPADRLAGRMVATSHGGGYETLTEVLRSLRKDVEINGMAHALANAASGRMAASGAGRLQFSRGA